MSIEKNTQATQAKRDLNSTGYRGMISFSKLFDLRATANHLRLYGLIEQMESSENATPTFSINYFAEQCGIKERQARYIASDLKEWGWVKRTRIKGNNYLWETVKNPVLITENAGCSESAGQGCSESAGQGCSESAPKDPRRKRSQNISKENIYKKEKTNTKNNKPTKPTKSPTPTKPTKQKEKLNIDDLLADNKHNIDEQVLRDFLTIRTARKAPLTKTAWKHLQNNLSKITQAGFDANEAMVICVTKGWQTVELKYIENLEKGMISSNYRSTQEKKLTGIQINNKEILRNKDMIAEGMRQLAEDSDFNDEDEVF